MITYNNIINSFKSFCKNHKQLKDFYSGQVYDFQARENIYPNMLITPNTCNIENGRFLYTFNIFITDLLIQDLRNKDEIISDCSLICGDIYTEFSDNYDNYGFTIDGNITKDTINEEIIDNVCGWVMTVNIQVPFSSSDCSLPLDYFFTNRTLVTNNYYNKTEVNNLLTGITIDMSNYYTTAQTYTKNECDNIFLTGLTFDIGDYYNKTEVNDLLTGITIDMSNYYTTAQTYTKNECDNKFLTGTTVDLSGYYTTAQTYNKTEVNDLISSNEINITLLSGSSWSTGLTQSVYVSGVTSTNEVYWNAASLSDNILAGQANLFCLNQSANSLTFICSTIPVNNINLKINIR
jgi:hypothetical protein